MTNHHTITDRLVADAVASKDQQHQAAVFQLMTRLHLSDDLLSELIHAHQIIIALLSLLTDAQKAQLSAVIPDHSGSGLMRYHERLAVISIAKQLRQTDPGVLS